MDVGFGSNALRRCYEDPKAGQRAWGATVARLFIRRVDQLAACANERDMRALRALRLHALAGKRKGQCAIDLDGFWRIILTFGATNEIVIVEEVSKHYGD
ncbi:MAG TPA: type II toxin-antitoxin system RelE/ParE family toxin [Candidatus Binatia bacterium]